jgi:hypothetical protein
MRVWNYAPYDATGLPVGIELSPVISARGLCLLHIEFLVRHPTSECVVTSAPDHMADLAGMFPRVLFHAFGRGQDPARVVPNLICHPAPFDRRMAEAFCRRGTPFTLICNGEEMTHQMALHLHARPACAFMLVTAAPETYLGGELLYPLWCRKGSSLCALVPGVDNGAFDYDPRSFLHALTAFHDSTRADDGYDRAMETLILQEYGRARGVGGETAELLAEVFRLGLPPADQEVRL